MMFKNLINIFGGRYKNATNAETFDYPSIFIESKHVQKYMEIMCETYGFTWKQSDAIVSENKIVLIFIDDDLVNFNNKRLQFKEMIDKIAIEKTRLINGQVITGTYFLMSFEAIIATPKINVNCFTDGLVAYRFVITF